MRPDSKSDFQAQTSNVDEAEERIFEINGTKIKESELSQEQKHLIKIIVSLNTQIGDLGQALDEKKLALKAALDELSKTVEKENTEST